MKFTRFAKITAPGATVGLMLLAVSLITGAVPVAAQVGQNGQLHIVKDCGVDALYFGIPGSSVCKILLSNIPEIPEGTLIYYDQPTGGPYGETPPPAQATAGPYGYLDSNIFVFWNTGQWAVGRCTVRNDNPLPPTPLGICTLSGGLGPLAGFTAQVTVTYITPVTYVPGVVNDGALYAWDGTYSFNSLPDR